jgi:hypothetical protein
MEHTEHTDASADEIAKVVFQIIVIFTIAFILGVVALIR